MSKQKKEKCSLMACFHESRILGIAINYAITHLLIFLILLMIDTGRK